MKGNPQVAHAHERSGMQEITNDTLFDGLLTCRQPRRGYRFSIDSVLLAHFPVIAPTETILDLGCGCGIIGLIMLYRNREKKVAVTGIETQSDLAQLALENIRANHMEDRFQIIAADVNEVRRHLAPESFSLVVANPPFYRHGSGRRSHNRQASRARHQEGDTLATFVDGAAFSVCNRGRAAFISDAGNLADVVQQLKKRNLEPKRMQFVYPYPDPAARAKLVLLEAVKNGGTGCNVLAPCYIYQKQGGVYSEVVRAMYRPS